MKRKYFIKVCRVLDALPLPLVVKNKIKDALYISGHSPIDGFIYDEWFGLYIEMGDSTPF